MGAVTTVTRRQVTPNPEVKVWTYRYTKGGATDTLDASGEFAVVDGVIARSNGGATDDPATVSSSTTITFSASTGASYAIVFGRGS